MGVPFNEVDKGSLIVVEYNEKHDCISAQTQLRAKTPPTQLVGLLIAIDYYFI